MSLIFITWFILCFVRIFCFNHKERISIALNAAVSGLKTIFNIFVILNCTANMVNIKKKKLIISRLDFYAVGVVGCS